MTTRRKQWLARAEAYDEAAEHLHQSWTDDPTEHTQGLIASNHLRNLAQHCRNHAKAKVSPSTAAHEPGAVS
jgi:surface antigen